MKRKKLILQSAGILLAALLLSCANDTEESNSSTGESNIESAELGGNTSQFLGSGYNVFGYYIHPKYASTNKIIDLDLAKKKLGFSKKKIGETDYQIKVGDSLSTYQKKLSTSVNASFGIGKLFSSSLSADFGEEFTGSNKYSYASVHANVMQYVYSINNVTTAGLPTLAECITPGFRASVEKYIESGDDFKPELLFNEYGTHLITAGTFGGRYDYYKVYSRVKASESYKLNVKLSASYSSDTGKDEKETNIAASSGVNSNNVNTSDVSELNSKARIVGGENALKSDLNDPKSYQDWLSSLKSEETWTLIGFDEGASNKGVLPIWELIEIMGTGKAGDKYYEFSKKVGAGYVEYAKEQNSKYAKADEAWRDPNDTGVQYVWDFHIHRFPNNCFNEYYKDKLYKEVEVRDGVKANVLYHIIGTDLRYNFGGPYEYIFIAYCTVYSDRIVVKDSEGNDIETTLEPVSAIAVDRESELRNGGYNNITDYLHDSPGNADWRIGFKRSKSNAIVEAYLNSSEVAKGPAGDVHSSAAVWDGNKQKVHRADNVAGKEQDLNKNLGSSSSDIHLWYITYE